ncbi:TolB family protein [Bacteroidota bacterium]
MKNTRKFVFIFLTLIVFVIHTFAQQKTNDKSIFPILTGPYLGQKPPGLTPEIFAPDFISTNLTDWTLTFMPDGREAYYTVQGLNNYNHLVCVKEKNGAWKEPEFASFTTPKHHADPFITSDGKKMFFWSNRPPKEGDAPTNNSDIWMVERINNAWGIPIRLDSIINTDHWQIFPTVSKKGNLYFSCNYDDSKGSFDIYMSEFIDCKYTKPINLGDSINTTFLEHEPYIAPDESYIIFCSDRHAPQTTNWDLYISFKRKDGNWSKAINMGDKINSDAMDQAAIVTSDGKYIFFSSQRTENDEYFKNHFYYKTLVEILNSIYNGNSNIFWIDATIIEELKHRSFN